MKIRLAPHGISTPQALGNWPSAEPNCDSEFKLGQDDHHRAKLGSGSAIFDKALALILSYSMFPQERLRAILSSGSKAAMGATVVQHAKASIFEFEMANRVVEVFDRHKDGVHEAGLKIVSLKGHPEQGAETFMVTQASDGTVELHIIANSRPGHWLTRIGAPWTRRVQLKATSECIRHMQEQAALIS